MLALQGKLTEQDLSNHLFREVYSLTAAYEINKEYDDVSNERMELKRRKYEKDLDNCKRIMKGETVIDPKYGDELDLDTAKKWVKR